MNASFPAETADLVLSAMQREAVAAEMFHVRRLAALARARSFRDAFFALKRKLDTNPWVWSQLSWPDDRNSEEELEVIRENWIEAMWGINRRVYG